MRYVIKYAKGYKNNAVTKAAGAAGAEVTLTPEINAPQDSK
jgi:hypothetical protein